MEKNLATFRLVTDRLHSSITEFTRLFGELDITQLAACLSQDAAARINSLDAPAPSQSKAAMAANVAPPTPVRSTGSPSSGVMPGVTPKARSPVWDPVNQGTWVPVSAYTGGKGGYRPATMATSGSSRSFRPGKKIAQVGLSPGHKATRKNTKVMLHAYQPRSCSRTPLARNNPVIVRGWNLKHDWRAT